MKVCKVMTEIEKAEAKSLSAFLTEIVGAAMARKCMRAELVRAGGCDGYEFRVQFNWHGSVFIDAKKLNEDRGERLKLLTAEAKAIVDAMSEGIAETVKR